MKRHNVLSLIMDTSSGQFSHVAKKRKLSVILMGQNSKETKDTEPRI